MGSGEILRLADGKPVLRNGPWSDTVGANVLYDGLFCYVSFAVELPADASGTAQKLWTLSAPVRGMGHQAWHGYGSPVRVGNVVYQQVEHANAAVFEAQTGKRISAQLFEDSKITEVTRGEIYPSLIHAGGHLFSADKVGRMAIYRIKPDHILEFVAEKSFAGPKKRGERRGDAFGGKMFVFAGDKAFIHAWDQLYCIGPGK